MSLFIPTYFSPIAQYAAIEKADKITFEFEDNYQKQSYRNRCYIYNGNGKQLLSIPVKASKKEGRKKTKDVLVENDFPWQDQHFKSIQTAYRVSPYFEFFEDDIQPIFTKRYKFLYDVTIDTFLFIADALQLEINFSKTEEYLLNPNETDFRHLAEIKQQPQQEFTTYVQMFDDKHGFIQNLSILDLLFMEGPNAINFF